MRPLEDEQIEPAPPPRPGLANFAWLVAADYSSLSPDERAEYDYRLRIVIHGLRPTNPWRPREPATDGGTQ